MSLRPKSFLRHNSFLVAILLIALVGLLPNCSCAGTTRSPSETTPPPNDYPPSDYPPNYEPPPITRIDGDISDVNLPSSVEGVVVFSISVEVENTGDVAANFEVRGSCAHLRITANEPRPKAIAPGESEVFPFQGTPFYAGEPETLASLLFELYAGQQLVDTVTETLWVFMPQVRFSDFKAETDFEWLGRGAIVNLTLEVKNEGRASARWVTVKAALLEDGTIKDSYSELIDYLAPGATHQIKNVILDGEVGHTYRIQIEVMDIVGSHEMRKSEEIMLDLPWGQIITFLLPLILL